jgi:hypothetical protein
LAFGLAVFSTLRAGAQQTPAPPANAKPAAAKPAAAKPPAAKPPAAKPPAAKPPAAKPETAKPPEEKPAEAKPAAATSTATAAVPGNTAAAPTTATVPSTGAAVEGPDNTNAAVTTNVAATTASAVNPPAPAVEPAATPAPVTPPPQTAAATNAEAVNLPAPAPEEYQLDTRLTLDPTVPYLGSLPGGTTPSFGEKPVGPGDWRFDFHGVLIAPIRAGINTRNDDGPNKDKTVLHAPPVVPDDRETFSHTGVVPNPYVQLNFSYGNSVITGNISILARQQTVAAGYFDPASQPGIYDAFLNIHPDLGKRVKLRAYVGAFSTRYGTMGEYDEGRYGTPLIARVNGVGENIQAVIGIDKKFSLILEQGLQGSSNKAPVDIYPDGWNDFANSTVGTSFVNHFHAGLSFAGKATLGGHFIDAFSRDERGTGTLAPDGRIRIFGADLHLNLGRFGHLFAGFAQTTAEHAATVARVVEVMNTRGGQGLMQHYLGERSNGNGKLIILGAQYDLSVGKLVSYPHEFTADGPDLVVSLFGINGKVAESDDPDKKGLGMLKLGGEVTYSMLSWLAAAVRYDRVQPDVQFDQRTFAVLSPRIIFHTDWSSTDQLVLQYSHWYNGSLVTVLSGYPPREDVTVVPDANMVSLSANMWW